MQLIGFSTFCYVFLFYFSFSLPNLRQFLPLPVSFAKRKIAIGKNVNFHQNIVYDAANAMVFIRVIPNNCTLSSSWLFYHCWNIIAEYIFFQIQFHGIETDHNFFSNRIIQVVLLEFINNSIKLLVYELSVINIYRIGFSHNDAWRAVSFVQ